METAGCPFVGSGHGGGNAAVLPDRYPTNISWGITASAEEAGAGTESGTQTWNEDDSLTWTLTADGTLTISGTGAMKDYYTNDSPATQKKDNVKKVVIEDGVTSIGAYAFERCSGLISITIPESVISIGESAFFKCSLTDITIPGSVTSIREFAFSGTPWLTNKIPTCKRYLKVV